MNMNSLYRQFRTFALCGVLVFLSACTIVRKVNVHPTNLAAAGKIPARIALVLDPSLATYKYHRSPYPDIWPLGPALTNYANHVTRHCFSQVTSCSKEAEVTDAAADIALHAKLHTMDIGVPATSFGEWTVTLVMQWTATDSASRATVWMKSVTGSYKGTLRGEQGRRFLQITFDDLSMKTAEAFRNSPELKRAVSMRN
jgi:hypothetical protein